MGQVLQMFGSLPQVEITPLMSTTLEETLQQLGRLQLEETLQHLGRLQLEETLQQLGRLQLEETLQQLGTLQLEEILQQLGTPQLEETLQQLGTLQLEETPQVGQARSSRIQPLFHQTSVLTRVVARSTTVGANASTSQRTSTGNDSRLSSTWLPATWPASVATQGSGWRTADAASA